MIRLKKENKRYRVVSLFFACYSPQPLTPAKDIILLNYSERDLIIVAKRAWVRCVLAKFKVRKITVLYWESLISLTETLISHRSI